MALRGHRGRTIGFTDDAGKDLMQTCLVLSTALLCHPPTDVDELFQWYDETLLELLNKHAPLRAVSYRASPGAPWYDAECRRMKTLTRKLEKRFRSHKSADTEANWRYQFEEQRKLFQSKYASYWSNVITSCQGNSKALWAKMRQLLDPPMSSNSVLSAFALSNYFDTKISKIRASTSMPLIAPRLIADHLRTLRSTNDDEIAELLRRAPPKQCKSDPAPTWLVKRFREQLTPVLVKMCNASISSNHLSTNHKAAIVTPILKKLTMETDPASYRPPLISLSCRNS